MLGADARVDLVVGVLRDEVRHAEDTAHPLSSMLSVTFW